MLIIDSSQAGQKHLVLVFGVGLVGKTVASLLQDIHCRLPIQMPFDWHDRKLRQKQSKALLTHIEKLFSTERTAIQVSVLWTAGSGGFNNSAEELSSEFDAFEDVLTLLKEIQKSFPDVLAGFHLASSAGGLFEGQKFVSGDTIPAPIRPYAENKLRQEITVSKLDTLTKTSVYRLSTVYGYQPGARAGLVSTVLSNTLRNRQSVIFGSPHTLRDFILVDDVARFIVDDLHSNSAGHNTHFVVSAKPSTINEVLLITREITKVPLYLKYDASPSNGLDNSYLGSCRPAGLHNTSLQVGIAQTLLKMTQSQIRSPL